MAYLQIPQPHLILSAEIGNPQRAHSLYHGPDSSKDILEDKFGKVSPLLLREPLAMDNPHLLDEGGLATLPSTYNVLLQDNRKQ